jgi:uncharacterized lipoprotein YbaY
MSGVESAVVYVLAFNLNDLIHEGHTYGVSAAVILRDRMTDMYNGELGRDLR